MVVEFVCGFVPDKIVDDDDGAGDDDDVNGAVTGEKNFFERRDGIEESLNEARRLSLKDVDDDDDDDPECPEVLFSERELRSNGVLLLL